MDNLNYMSNEKDIEIVNNLKSNFIDNDRIDIINYNSCSVELQFKDPENIGIDTIKCTQYFINNIKNIESFLNNVQLLNISSGTGDNIGRLMSFIVKSYGHVTLFCKRYNKNNHMPNTNMGNNLLFKLNIDIINKIFNGKYNLDVLFYYYKYFPINCKFINTSDCFMIPNFGKFYADMHTVRNMVNIIKKYKMFYNSNKQIHCNENVITREMLDISKNNMSITQNDISQLYTTTYKVYVKDTNININLSKTEIINAFHKSKYRHIFYLDSTDLNKFNNIKCSVLLFFARHTVNIDDIDIRINLNELRYKTHWITLDITLRNIKYNYYKVNPEIYERNTITIDELIDTLQLCTNGKIVADFLNNKYDILLPEFTIKDYGISINDSIKTIQTSLNRNIKKKLNVSKHYYKQIIDNFSILNTVSLESAIIPPKSKNGKYNGKITNGYIVHNEEKIHIGKEGDIEIELENCDISGNYDDNGYFTGTIVD